MAPKPEQDQILALLKQPLEKLIKERIDGEVDFEKTWQYLRLRKADNYYRGLQFNSPGLVNGFADWTPAGYSSSLSGSDAEHRGVYDYNIDIIKSFGRKYFGVLGIRPFFNLKALPDDPQSELDKAAAQQAELASLWLDAKWCIRIRNIEVFYHQWKSGTVYAYTPYVADKDLFGEVEEPQYAPRTITVEPAGFRCMNCGTKTPEQAINPAAPACPKCGAPLNPANREEPQTAQVPEFQGTQKYPGSGPALRLCTGYTVTVPFNSASEDGRITAPYLLYEYEENQGKLLQMFGETLRPMLQDQAQGNGSVNSQQGLLSRQAAQSIMGMPRQGSQSTWTYSRYWLTPAMYEYEKDENLRAILYQKYPDGLKVHRVQDKVVKLETEALNEVWSLFLPEPADTIYHDPACWGILGHQDITNDAANIRMALLERGGPTYLTDPDVLSADIINAKSYAPGSWVEAKPGFGSHLDSGVKVLQGATFPEHATEFIGEIAQNAQEHTGLLPAVYGGGERQATAEGQRTVLNQALMQLGVPGEFAQQGWVNCKTNAIRQIAKYAPKGFAVTNGQQGRSATGDMLDIDSLRSGKWHLVAEPGIPMSFSELRDQLNGIVQENPKLASALGLDSPKNVGVVHKYLLSNTPELRVPGEELRDKVIETIQELLQQEPIQGPDGQFQPSIPPEDFVEDPQACAEIAKEWLLDKPGRKAKQTNPKGYANVVAWALAQNAKVPPPPAPEMKGTVSISLKPEAYPPEVQAQILNQAGVKVDPGQLAVAPPMPPTGPPPEGAPDEGSAPPPPDQPLTPKGGALKAVNPVPTGPEAVQPHVQ